MVEERIIRAGDGWMYGWMDGERVIRIDGLLRILSSEQMMDECMGEWLVGWLDGWVTRMGGLVD